jgi:hypothetical protein
MTTPHQQVKQLAEAIENAIKLLEVESPHPANAGGLKSAWLAAKPLVEAAPELLANLKSITTGMWAGENYSNPRVSGYEVAKARKLMDSITPPADAQLERETCPDCSGRGLKPGENDWFTCPTCSGLGVKNTRAKGKV